MSTHAAPSAATDKKWRGLFSADGHIAEPEDLWLRRMPASFRDSAPRLHRDEQGVRYWIVGDERRQYPGTQPKRTAAAVPAPQPNILEEFLQWSDPKARLRAYDELGIEAEVLYAQETLFLLYGLRDPDLQSMVLYVYNEWLAECCSVAPDRLIGIGALPIHDAAAARSEIEHIKALGLRGCFIPAVLPGVRYNSSFYEDLWTSVGESGLPLTLHINPAGDLPHSGRGAMMANILMHTTFRHIWPIFYYSGILERHPDLRLVLTEGGINWLPTTLADADRAFFRDGGRTNPIALSATETWRRQCFATFIEDAEGLGLRDLDRIGPETVMWGSDFPHPEGTNFDTQDLLERQLGQLRPEDANRIVRDNARRVWSLP